MKIEKIPGRACCHTLESFPTAGVSKADGAMLLFGFWVGEFLEGDPGRGGIGFWEFGF